MPPSVQFIAAKSLEGMGEEDATEVKAESPTT
jgi:hypothetical protein